MMINWFGVEVKTRFCFFSCKTSSFGSSHQVEVDVVLVVLAQLPAVGCWFTYFRIFGAVVECRERDGAAENRTLGVGVFG
jgi:hypothetical protein